MNELGKWAQETEIQPGQGTLTVSGEWSVNMMSLQNSAAADNLQKQLHDAGFAADIRKRRLAVRHGCVSVSKVSCHVRMPAVLPAPSIISTAYSARG
jgi:hypothetical protein